MGPGRCHCSGIAYVLLPCAEHSQILCFSWAGVTGLISLCKEAISSKYLVLNS